MPSISETRAITEDGCLASAARPETAKIASDLADFKIERRTNFISECQSLLILLLPHRLQHGLTQELLARKSPVIVPGPGDLSHYDHFSRKLTSNDSDCFQV